MKNKMFTQVSLLVLCLIIAVTSQAHSAAAKEKNPPALQLLTTNKSNTMCSKKLQTCTVVLPSCNANTNITIQNNSSQPINNISVTIPATVSGLTVSTALCPNPLPAGATCDINFSTTGVYPGATPQNTNIPATLRGDGTIPLQFFLFITPSCSTTLTTSQTDLALSVINLTEYGIGSPSGISRSITITNTGSITASNLIISQPTWPSGTSISTTCGSSLPASQNCTITVIPGNTPTPDGSSNPCWNGTTPIPGVLQVSADNASAVATNVLVLSYSCIYQGGYIYAFDDTTATTTSVGGKVVPTFNSSNNSLWSSNSLGSYDGGVAIYGISEISIATIPGANPNSGMVTGQVPCNGNIDGACDTNNIYVYYQTIPAGAPINPNFYAAGLCKQSISGFADWYLPSICELGYDNASQGTGCGSAGAPTLQNVQSNLVEYRSLGLLGGFFWSSTESSADPVNSAWRNQVGGANAQISVNKGTTLIVRCSRVF